MTDLSISNTDNTSSSHLMPVFNRLPISFVRGEGVYLFDHQGRSYLDGLSGIAVNTLGHQHPVLVPALQAQIAQLIHVSNLYQVDQQEQLAARLAQVSSMDHVFFANSGAEANEGAIKLARLYGQQQGKVQGKIVVMSDAFHGRTLATLSATGNGKVQKGFEPLVSGFVRVPFNDIEAVKALSNDPEVVAVMLEVIQGEGGIQILKPGLLNELRALCDQHQWLLMLDEVQTGIGRTGRWFAHQHEGVIPDVMTLAKGLGSGVPVGAILTAGRATGVFHVGAHGSTFGGNPLAMVAGLTTLQVIESDQLLDNASVQGQLIRDQLALVLASEINNGQVVDIRGQGLMIGIELNRPCTELVSRALAQGFLINVTHDCVVRLLPALVYRNQDSLALADGVGLIIKGFLSEERP